MYTVKIDKETFDLIKSGKKIYEIQINHGNDVVVGDHILFKKKPDLFDGVLAKVLEKRIFSSFLEMASILSIDELGYEGYTNYGVEDECRKIFDKELEEKFGVVVYQIKVLK